MTHYELLGVARDADAKTIKAAYRKKAMECHPDKHGGDGEPMAKLNEAYACLTDPGARAAYDLDPSVKFDDDLDKKAYDQLLVLIDTFIMVEAPDLPAAMAMHWQDFAIRNARDLQFAKRDKATFEKKWRRRVTHAGDGENLVEKVVERKLLEFDEKIAAINFGIEIGRRAQELFIGYRDAGYAAGDGPRMLEGSRGRLAWGDRP